MVFVRKEAGDDIDEASAARGKLAYCSAREYYCSRSDGGPAGAGPGEGDGYVARSASMGDHLSGGDGPTDSHRAGKCPLPGCR